MQQGVAVRASTPSAAEGMGDGDWIAASAEKDIHFWPPCELTRREKEADPSGHSKGNSGGFCP